MTDIVDAARYIVQISYKKEKHSLTNLRLQKILYLVQGWSYVWDGVPAFTGDFVLWGMGPASPNTHAVFSKYGRDEIPICEGKSCLSDKNVEETIDAVWEEYGKMNTYGLVEFVRGLPPDRQTVGEGGNIPDEPIREIFCSRYPV